LEPLSFCVGIAGLGGVAADGPSGINTFWTDT